MKERKENINRTVKNKVIKHLIIYDFIWFGVVIILTLLPILFGEEPFNNGNYIPIIIIFLVIIFIMNVPVGWGLYFNFSERDKLKQSKDLVKNVLSKDTYQEVIPNKVLLRYCTFIKSELPALAKFFAVLSEDDKYVLILLKFDKYDGYKFLEAVEKEEFTEWYKIKE